MNRTSKTWLLAFSLVCIGLLLPLIFWGMQDPLSLTHLLVAGGLVESLPAVVLGAAAVLSLAMAWRLYQTHQAFRSWVLLSGLCVFFVGEEASWGQESVLGWQAVGTPGTEKWDLHNWLTGGPLQVLAEALGLKDFVTVGLVAIGVAAAFAPVLLWRLKKRRQHLAPLIHGILNRPPLTFFLSGLALIILGNSLDAVWEIGLPYFRGQWPLEEALELLGSVALLFAPLTRVHEEFRSARARPG